MSLSSFLDLSRAMQDSLAAAFVTRRGVSDAVDHRQVPIEDDAAAAQDGKPAGVMATAADGATRVSVYMTCRIGSRPLLSHVTDVGVAVWRLVWSESLLVEIGCETDAAVFGRRRVRQLPDRGEDCGDRLIVGGELFLETRERVGQVLAVLFAAAL